MGKVYFRLNAPDVSAEDFKTEILALNLKNGHYHSLREAAISVWRLFMLGCSEEEIINQLPTFYLCDKSIIENEVKNFIQELETMELIVREGKPVLAVPADVLKCLHDLPGTYVPPLLETYTDMRDLLKLDPIHDVDVAGWPHVPAPPEKSSLNI